MTPIDATAYLTALPRRRRFDWHRRVRTPLAALACAALTGGFSAYEAAPPLAPAPEPARPESVTEAPASPVTPAVETIAEREQRVVSAMLAKRYRVAHDAVAGFVEAAYRIGLQTKVDPLLILAVMSVESRFNPVAESSFGALGLMQIIPKFHMEKLAVHGGKEALLDPHVNILVGAQILREYLRRFGGIEAALQGYAGAYDEPTFQYAGKVLSERARLEQLVAKRRQAV